MQIRFCIPLHSFIIAFFCIALTCCHSKKNKSKHLAFELLLENSSRTIKHGDSIDLHILHTNKEHAEAAYLKLFINNQYIQKLPYKDHLSIPTDTLTVGGHTIQLKIEYKEKGDFTATKKVTILSDIIPDQKKYKIHNIYPHDRTAYTQGLEFSSAGVLYESTGKYGFSELRKTNVKTGKVEKKSMLQSHFFGEGMTLLNNKIYQLTWQEMTFFVYDKASLQEIKKVRYPKNIQGWGLCNNGQQLIMSDGTATIYFLNATNFEIEKTIQVYDHKGKIDLINELEYINGKVYANVYTKDFIIVIDPKTGKVLSKIRFDGILKKEDIDDNTDVLNGIAYHPNRKSFFITGKNWPKLFEVTFIDDTAP